MQKLLRTLPPFLPESRGIATNVGSRTQLALSEMHSVPNLRSQRRPKTPLLTMHQRFSPTLFTTKSAKNGGGASQRVMEMRYLSQMFQVRSTFKLFKQIKIVKHIDKIIGIGVLKLCEK